MRRFALLAVLLSGVSCKTTSNSSSLRESEPTANIPTAIEKVKKAIASWEQLDGWHEKWYVPTTEKWNSAVKFSHILAAQEAYDAALDALDKANFQQPEGVRDRYLDSDRELKKIFGLVTLEELPWYLNFDFVESVRNFYYAPKFGQLWDYCGYALNGGKKSEAYFRDKMSTMGFAYGDVYKYDGLGAWFYEDEFRELFWLLAGKPTYRSNGTNYKSLPPKPDWKPFYDSWRAAVSDSIRDVRNIKEMHAYALKHCPQVMITIDEVRIQKGVNAIQTWDYGGDEGISKWGITRQLSKKAFKEKVIDPRLDLLKLNLTMLEALQ